MASRWRSSKTTMPRRNEDVSEYAVARGVPERFSGVETGLFFRAKSIPARSPSTAPHAPPIAWPCIRREVAYRITSGISTSA